MLGGRPGLVAALAADGVPHHVWNDPARRWPAESLAELGGFTHVLAGTEATVVPAALAREKLGARRFPRVTAHRCHDKLVMKRYLEQRGIAMTPYRDGSARSSADEIVRELGLPVVLKDRRRSGGRGMVVLQEEDSVARAARRGRILERWVEAEEASIESFVSDRIVRFVNVTEYVRKGAVNAVPAALDAATTAKLLELNRRVVGALGIRWGMTHVEAYLTCGDLLFGEIALRPPGGYIMDLIELAWGFDPWRAFLAVELGRGFDFPAAPSAHAAAVVLHPGAGTVRAVHGLDEVRRHPGVVRATIKVGAGDRVTPRLGVGESVGRVLLRAATRDELLAALRHVDSTLSVELDPVAE
ncbi:MAG: ATP-grasp domain-containing protein [Candidatus Eiseniibacteriota bacterium]